MITTLIAIVNTLCTTGNKDFPANFKITDQAHVYVYFIDGDEEVPEVLLTQVTSFTAGEGNEYKVNSISETGFNVELRDAYDTSDGRKISTRRIVPVTQAIDYPPGNDFPAATHERALDKLTAIVQQLGERIIRQIGVPLSEDASETSLLMPAYISNYYLGLDGDNELIWKVGTVAVGNNEIKDSHIDWGTASEQVSAVDMPIADAGGIITATEVEGALQENRTALDVEEAALVTHKVNNGSDHDFIDQDVKVAASPIFANMASGSDNNQDVKTTANPTFNDLALNGDLNTTIIDVGTKNIALGSTTGGAIYTLLENIASVTNKKIKANGNIHLASGILNPIVYFRRFDATTIIIEYIRGSDGVNWTYSAVEDAVDVVSHFRLVW